jgi:transporter family protein
MNWIILILLSAIFMTIRTIFLKKDLDHDGTIITTFIMSTTILLITSIFNKNINLYLSPLTYFLLIIKSLIIAITWICLFQAYKILNISTVSPLRNLSPIILLVLSYFILNETLSFINFIGIIILILSAYALEIHSFKNIAEPLKIFKSKSFVLIIISFLGNSISAILDKIILKHTNPETTMYFFYFLISTIFFVIIIIKKLLANLIKSIKTNALNLMFVGIFAYLSDLTYFFAVSNPKTLISIIIPLRRLSTLLTTLIGGSMFKEKNLFYKGAICCIMIFGVFLVIF